MGMPKPIDQINQEFQAEFYQKQSGLIEILHIEEPQVEHKHPQIDKDRAITPLKNYNDGDRPVNWMSTYDTDPNGIAIPPYYSADTKTDQSTVLTEPSIKIRKHRKKIQKKPNMAARRKIKKHVKVKRFPLIVSVVLVFFSILIYLLSASIYYNVRNGGLLVFNYFILPQLSDNMEPKIPYGSLLIIKSISPAALNNEDTIVVSRSKAVYITQSIVSIETSTGGANGIEFTTRGLNEGAVGASLIKPSQVRGRVVFFIPVLGAVMSVIANNLLIIGVIYIGLVFIIRQLKKLFQPEKQKVREIKKKRRGLS